MKACAAGNRNGGRVEQDAARENAEYDAGEMQEKELSMNRTGPTGTSYRQRPAAVPLLLMALLVAAFGARAEIPDGNGTYDQLVTLFQDLQTWEQAQAAGIPPDYSPPAIERRRAELRAMRERMRRMGVRRWPVARQVDYLTVRAELDQQEFILEVTRPWSRNPAFYVEPLRELAFAELPVNGEDLVDLQRRLQSVPELLAAARENLTDAAADFADFAIRSLTLSDGVENGYPYREKPPHGVIGWFEDLYSRAEAQPELREDIAAALAAIRDFHRWLVDNREGMTAPNGVGEEALDWFVQNALLLPYTSAEMVVLAERELDRLWAFYALERNRNRRLPELEIARSRAEYRERLAATDRHLRDWIREEAFISIPEYIPTDWQEMGYNVPWIERATPPNFWEQVQFRDPSPDHLHAVIPGHRFDALVAANNPHPIRGKVNFHARWQGWAVYLEEGALQAGALEGRPRTRELIYIFGIWRAARTLGDIYNQRNEMTAAETSEYWSDITPMLDPDVARKYAYLRPEPGHGLDYTIGNIQMFRLLGRRKHQLGDAFVLRDFHDEFISKGRIPISLIRYEMTGYDRDVASFWKRRPLSSVISR